jgi:hypothetical protein
MEHGSFVALTCLVQHITELLDGFDESAVESVPAVINPLIVVRKRMMFS